jgi:N-methylhydantoinase A
VAQFHRDHEQLYGFWRPDEPIEVVSVRLQVRLPIDRGVAQGRRSGNGHGALLGQRPVLFDLARGPQPTNVYDGDRLGPGTHLPGPAVVHRLDGTVPIPPQWQGEVDAHGHLILTRR